MNDTIAAIATGHQATAIGILRLSGPQAISALDQVFTPVRGKPMAEQPNRLLVYGTLHDAQGNALDHCLATVSRGPHSYTGEDTAELQCHGSPVLLTMALEALFACGVRQAQAGEFTRRAFLAGKMDLTRTEAVADLIHAETQGAVYQAAGQLGGALAQVIEDIYHQLTALMAHFHAVLDYPDEDIDPFVLSDLRGNLTRDMDALRAILRTYGRGQVLRRGIRAVILGKPNAGKSSLLNALAGYDRVIVTDIAGTTRDTVEESVKVGRHLLRLLDTAGIRDTADEIERQGVLRAEAAARDADLAIYVCDSAVPLTEEDLRAQDAALEAPAAVAILNKQDLPPVVEPSDLPFEWIIPVSAKTGEGLSQLEDALDVLFPDETPSDGSILTNARQAAAVARAVEALERTVQGLDDAMTPDAVLTDVEAALEALGEITGKSMREEIVSRIFSRFCVGK